MALSVKDVIQGPAVFLARKVYSRTPLNFKEHVAGEFSLTEARVVKAWTRIDEDTDREIKTAQRRMGSRQQEIDRRVHILATAQGCTGKGRTAKKHRRELRDAISRKLVVWPPQLGQKPEFSWVEKVEYVRAVFEALGSPSPDTIITVDTDMVRRVSPIAHRAPSDVLEALGLGKMTDEVGIVHMGCHNEVQADFIVGLITDFDCTALKGNLHV